MPEYPVTVRLDADGVPSVEAPGQVKTFTMPERIKRGGTLMLITLLVALPFVFIPIIHFLAVPMIVVFGGVMSVKQLSSVYRLAPMRMPCPKCGASNRVGGGVGYRSLEAKDQMCSSCRRNLTLRIVPIADSQVPPAPAHTS